MAQGADALVLTTAQFDVHRTRGAAARLAPFLVVLQSDLVSRTGTVIVAPVRRSADHGAIIRHLHVVVEFQNVRHVVAVEQLVSLPYAALGPRAGSLAAARRELMDAVDFLFMGY